ncbi:MAG: hypothetical protein M1828_006295 [Chrysothrix sp. TS-e1954]|nr:MAG: hypothetical protein M1828_006295 [Chrysothrix sp. TS-e1954]
MSCDIVYIIAKFKPVVILAITTTDSVHATQSLASQKGVTTEELSAVSPKKPVQIASNLSDLPSVSASYFARSPNSPIPEPLSSPKLLILDPSFNIPPRQFDCSHFTQTDKVRKAFPTPQPSSFPTPRHLVKHSSTAKMAKPKIDVEDKKYNLLKGIYEGATLDSAQWKTLLKEAQSFVKSNSGACEVIPRQFTNPKWKEFATRFAEAVGGRFWTEKRNGFKKDNDFVWPDDRDTITFFAFAILKFESIKHVAQIRKERALEELPDKDAPTGSGISEKRDGSSTGKKNAKKQKLQNPATPEEESEDSEPSSSDEVVGKTPGGAKVHKGDPFGPARVARGLEGSSSPTTPSKSLKHARPESLVVQSAAKMANTKSIPSHFQMDVPELDPEASKKARGKQNGASKKPRLTNTGANKSGGVKLGGPPKSQKSKVSNGSRPNDDANDEDGIDGEGDEHVQQTKINGHSDAKDGGSADEPYQSIEGETFPIGGLRSTASMDAMLDACAGDASSSSPTPQPMSKPAVKLMFQITIRDPENMWTLDAPTSSTAAKIDADAPMPDATAPVKAAMDSDPNEPNPDEPVVDDSKAKIPKGTTPAPEEEACVFAGDSTISWMAFFGKVSMHVSKEQALALPKTTRCQVRIGPKGRSRNFPYRTVEDIEDIWSFMMKKATSDEHAQRDAMLEEEEGDQMEEFESGEVGVTFY